MEARTLEVLLRKRNTQFTAWILCPIVFSYLVLQCLFFANEMNEAKKQMILWKETNLPRIAHAIFLKNESDLKAIVAEQKTGDGAKYLKLQFQIFDQKKRLLISGGQEKPIGNEVVLRSEPKIDYLKGEISDGAPIILGGRNQGFLVIQASYPWPIVIKPSLILFLSCISIFLVLKFGVWLWVLTLRRSVVRPLEKLNLEISLKIDQIASLKAVPLCNPDFRYAPKELVLLVKSYNELVANIQRLRERENAFVAEAAKFEVASQVAHDIRSPLAALSLAIEELPPMSDIQKEIFINVAKRINTIGDELLKSRKGELVTKVISQEKSKKPVASLVEVVQNIVKEKEILVTHKPKVKISIPEVPDIRVVAESTNLQRVLSNLMDNAIEAVGDEGEISMKFTLADGKLYLSVKDNGKGIPREYFHRVWEPGFSYGKKNGNGLGLSFVKNTCEGWGGHVTLDSAVGKGTVISLQLKLPDSITE